MSMSCSPSTSPQHHDAPAMDLLDEYWFFSNTLVNNKPPRSPSTTVMSNKGSAAGSSRFYAASVSGSGSGGRKLLRTPSLPSPRRVRVAQDREEEEEEEEEVEEEEEEEEEEEANDKNNQQRQLLADAHQHHQDDQAPVDDDDLNWSSIYEGVLRTRMAAAEGGRRSRGSRSALQRAPSMPLVPSSSSSSSAAARDHQTSTPSSMPRLRHSYSTLERHNHNHTAGNGIIANKQQRASCLVRSNSNKTCSSGFQADKKKWNSWSDLESIEVQGFRDLGFVFDKEELRESLADVLPGLKQHNHHHHHQAQMTISPRVGVGGSGVRRPYLSEAWGQHVQVQQRRPAALLRVQSSSTSSEMKDQLRMWAQAVACNVRHEH